MELNFFHGQSYYYKPTQEFNCSLPTLAAASRNSIKLGLKSIQCFACNEIVKFMPTLSWENFGVRYEFNHLCTYGSLQGSESSQEKSQGLTIHRILDLQAIGPLNNLNVASYSSLCSHLIITHCYYLNIYI
jgi:hypothetical protein